MRRCLVAGRMLRAGIHVRKHIIVPKVPAAARLDQLTATGTTHATRVHKRHPLGTKLAVPPTVLAAVSAIEPRLSWVFRHRTS